MPVSIEDAVESYLTEREPELSDSSIQNHRYQLKQFRQWCGSEGIEGVGGLDPIDLSRFRRDRSQDINSTTMYNQLSSVRLLLRFCVRMQWVDESLPEAIVLPTRSGVARDRSLNPDRVADILDELDKYDRGSRQHVILALTYTAGFRIGALRGLDIGDVYTDDMYIEVVHRPGTDTPLKNKAGSEREVNVHGWVAGVLTDWMDDRRPDSTDAHGRDPLIATTEGRISRSSIRRTVYRLTDCSDVSTKEGCNCSDRSSMCPDSVSPHDLRRTCVSAWLQDGYPRDLVGERCDISPEVLSKHYDARSSSDRRRSRRDAFDM